MTGGRPLVLLHGFLGSARNLTSLARGLRQGAPGYDVHAIDLPGHGHGPALPRDADLAALARTTLVSLQRLRLAPPLVLAGHSLGGRVALRLAGLEPSLVGHLVLLDITPASRPPAADTAALVQALLAAPATGSTRAEFRAYFAQAGMAPALTDWLLMNLERAGEGLHWRIDRVALAALLPRIGADDLWPAVEGVRDYSVHAVRGGRSPYVPDDDARRLAAAGARVDTVDGAGHFLHVDRPAETLERILKGLP